ncbi:MAG: WD40/YVTN/BNR-like repeat-containing protein [Ktedonobacteraceae bacterium]
MANEQETQERTTIDPTMLNALEWRSIGPYRGGRVVAVAGDPVHPQVFYFGSTGGGVWKTNDGGLYWTNVSDGYFKRASVGALAVAPSDPNVIYAGMGEATIRGNVSHGDGVYKSTDMGKTWIHLGLEDTRHIGKVRIHPQNPDVVYVAALGHAHGPNAERGVYRSRDGGKTWENVLFKSEKAGAIDLAIDPNNPRILYASFWEAQRLPHTLISGGEDSGIYKSTDGGDTWTDITCKPGLPTGLLGKIGLAVSPAKAERVWAIIEAEDGAVFRSDDGGEHWQRLSEERPIRARAWYYQHIIADPQDAETLWALNVQAWKSIDGGRSFFEVPIPHGDHHDLWIDPRNPLRMIEGNDGGACVSYNGSDSWSSIYNQPTEEFYHVTTDTQVPYRVYGAQQDNSTLSVPSRSPLAGITIADCYEVGGGESGYIAVRPDDPNIVFAGNYQGYITRYDHRSNQHRNIAVWPELASGWGAIDQKYRFQWTCPILLSPHDPHVLYMTGNHVFRSTDEGSSWEIISPDLTRNDPTKLESSGGPITKDNTGAEYYCTIFAFTESPIERGLFWAGSDDGLIHISHDNGENWENVTPAGLPEWALISIIEPSPHDAATAYVAATRYKLDDFQPYLFKTNDYGKTWTSISANIAANAITRVIREDPERSGLLYAGTETGMLVSFDDGANWQSLKLNLPVVPIHDMVIKNDDLVAATHGRGFWILDDVTPLRQMREELHNEAAHLFTPRAAIHYMTDWGFSRAAGAGKFYRNTGATTVASIRTQKPNGATVDYNIDAGQNPPDGVIVSYYLKQKLEGEVTLTFLDAEGKEIKSFSSKEKGKEPGEVEKSTVIRGQEKEPQEQRVAKEAGANRFAWNMRYPDPSKVEGYAGAEGVLTGPTAAPGTYQVRLSVDDQHYTASFEIQKDPRIAATQEDLTAQFALRMKICDKLTATHDAITTLRSVRQQIEEWERRTQGQQDNEKLQEAAKPLKETLSSIEEELIQVKAKTRQDTLNHPAKLNAKLAALSGTVGSADAAPTRQEYELFDALAARVDVQLKRLQTVIDTDVAAFNNLIREQGVSAVIAKPDLKV